MVSRRLLKPGSLSLLLAGCSSSGDQTNDSYRFALPQPPVRAQVIALAKCPSPLKRLKLAAMQRQVSQPELNTIVLTIPASDAPQPIELRFRFDSDNQPGAPLTTVRFHLTVPDGARELELGPDQIIAPAVFSKELSIALKSYFELGMGFQTARPIDNSAKIAQKCAEIGRLLDDGAVLISPALASELKRQHRREALNWLFKDGYELSTEGVPEYQGDYNNYEY